MYWNHNYFLFALATCNHRGGNMSLCEGHALSGTVWTQPVTLSWLSWNELWLCYCTAWNTNLCRVILTGAFPSYYCNQTQGCHSSKWSCRCFIQIIYSFGFKEQIWQHASEEFFCRHSSYLLSWWDIIHIFSFSMLELLLCLFIITRNKSVAFML